MTCEADLAIALANCEKLRAALKPFADKYDELPDPEAAPDSSYMMMEVKDFRAASNAMKETAP